jgi:hypothetical protein
VRVAERIGRVCIRIGRTYELTGSIKAQTGKGLVAGINNGWATVDSADSRLADSRRRGVLVTASRVSLFLPHAPRNTFGHRPLP